MRRLIVVLIFAATACAPASLTTTTSQPEPTTTPRPVTTTTSEPEAVPLQIGDCSSPPVTFSALCEVYEIVQEWHVDRPVPAQDMADVALRALEEFVSSETEPPPRTLFCAIPSDAFMGLCEELARRVQSSQIAVGPAVDAAVLAMADLGLDPFSYYVPPDQVGSVRGNGIVGGVGILLDATDAVGSRCVQITEACPLQVVFVLEDNPGEEVGLRAGDEIVAVDGESVVAQGFTATAARIAGDETGTVELTVERAGETLVFEIERAELTIPTVEVQLPQPQVGYLRIPDFEDDIPGLVDEALASLVEFDPSTIVIDLRDNPGGLVDAAVEVASQFIDGGLVMETLAPNERLEYPAAQGGLGTTQRLIVIVNQGTASAAEVVAGALHDRRDAFLIGTNTFGKDAVQIPFDLRNGGELYVAVARWVTPNGLTAGNGGLDPDRELKLAPEMTVEELVQTALDTTP